MKEGLYDVIAPADLAGLTADDMQLLLSGRAEPVRALSPLLSPAFFFRCVLVAVVTQLSAAPSQVSVEQLKKLAVFEDARGAAVREKDPAALEQFRTLFWETVTHVYCANWVGGWVCMCVCMCVLGVCALGVVRVCCLEVVTVHRTFLPPHLHLHPALVCVFASRHLMRPPLPLPSGRVDG